MTATPALLEHNLLNLDFGQPVPRPKVRGKVIDFHCHLLSVRHAPAWFEAADLFGIDVFVTMMQLEEAVSLYRDYGERLMFIAVPEWHNVVADPVEDYLRRIEGFYNLGARIVKFHSAPESMRRRGFPLDSPRFERVFAEVAARGMGIMTHIGDPDTWYAGKYAEAATFGTRQQHYEMWENLLNRYPQVPWIGAHMGGHPEDLNHLRGIMERHANVSLDSSATKWVARSLSSQREAAREFFLTYQDRILFGSDQVSGDERGRDFYASRFWVQRKMWETAYIGPSPIMDRDFDADSQPTLRGLALPDEVLQKLYHGNAVRYLQSLGVNTGWLE